MKTKKFTEAPTNNHNTEYRVSPDAIYAARKRLGWTLDQAAEAAGFLTPEGEPARQRWHDIESGRRPNITAATLAQVARALGCPMDDFISSGRATPATGSTGSTGSVS